MENKPLFIAQMVHEKVCCLSPNFNSGYLKRPIAIKTPDA